MLNIKQFEIGQSGESLNIALASDDSELSEQWPFSVEYLRVVSLQGFNTKQAIPTHKKHVKLLRIEAVAKHGYRFCFDDQHEVIYSTSELALLHQQSDTLWQQYLIALAQTGHSRETSIEIKQL
ncbi:DUF971 domain-containing protein [Thalassotalea sp. M1531]|uniref:DUF971 domain-containing protein n=1 Tax=Thalassotalea algicola TaxID=2716224 RepID=A0A7Y0LFY5_9GAMM|nr:gamma-butyrobetaine hydroxylase-like domain-containing protein [Thalassotalea algicola]NMP33539.1 DUF971 domain-containing protein [Thalassotalea algicola]